jgi:hypothetical protein
MVFVCACTFHSLFFQVRIPLYEALLHLLVASGSPASLHDDISVKISAVQTIESLVNDWGFEKEAFLPFFPHAIDVLYALIVHPRIQTTETRLKILGYG